MWNIFKVFIELVTIPLLFYVWFFFGHKACGILAPQPGIEPVPSALEGEVLTARPPGKSLINHLNHTLKTVIDEKLVFKNKKCKEKEWIKEQQQKKEDQRDVNEGKRGTGVEKTRCGFAQRSTLVEPAIHFWDSISLPVFLWGLLAFSLNG